LSAGRSGQLGNAVAIGRASANTNQGASAVAIGLFAGFASQGANSIAIGASAGRSTQPANTIILNATGANLNVTTENAMYVKPVRNASTTNIVNYNTSTGEIAYDGNVDANGFGSFTAPADNINTLTLTGVERAGSNDIRIERYQNASTLGGFVGTMNIYRAGWDGSAPEGVANGDSILEIFTTAYSDSGNIFVDTGGFRIVVDENDGAGKITTIATYYQGADSGSVNFNYDAINFNGISNLGSNSNVVITGGNVSDVLTTDGTGNLSWAPQSGGGGGETFNVFLLAGM
jgi:hypothetical protein